MEGMATSGDNVVAACPSKELKTLAPSLFLLANAARTVRSKADPVAEQSAMLTSTTKTMKEAGGQK